MEAEHFAQLMDIDDNATDGLLRRLQVTLSPVSSKKKLKPPIKPMVKYEKNESIFHQTWDYSQDAVFGPIVDGLKRGFRDESLEKLLLTSMRLVKFVE